MGSARAAEIEDTLQDLSELNKRTGRGFKELKQRIQKLGTKDYGMRRAYIYQQTLMKELELLKNQHHEFEKIYEHLKGIKNPEIFYEEVKKSQALQDFFSWYKNPVDFAEFEDFSDIAKYVANEFEIDIE